MALEMCLISVQIFGIYWIQLAIDNIPGKNVQVKNIK